MVRYILCALLVFIISDCVIAQSHEAVIWRGFEFRWKNTNHRLNSFTSYSKLQNDGVHIFNGASSGSQSDVWGIKSYLTYISDQSMWFTSIEKDSFFLAGMLNDTIIYRDTIWPKLRDGLNAEVFFNGFRTTSIRDAAKLAIMDVSVGSVMFAKDKRPYCVVTYSFLFQCEKLKGCYKNFECNDKENLFNYSFHPFYLLVEAPGIFYANDTMTGSSVWKKQTGGLFGRPMRAAYDADSKGHLKDKGITHAWSKDSLYNISTCKSAVSDAVKPFFFTAIKSFRINVTMENHLLIWSNFISPTLEYGFLSDHSKDAPLNTDTILAGLYYSPWRFRPSVVFAFGSKVEPGECNMQMTTKSVNINESAIVNHIKYYDTKRYKVRSKKNSFTENLLLVDSIKRETVNAGLITDEMSKTIH